MRNFIGGLCFLLVIFAIFSYGAVSSGVTLFSWLVGGVGLALTELKK